MPQNVACAACGGWNPAEGRACSRCGRPLSLHCLACGSPAGPGARFCGQCGQPLAQAPDAAAAAPQAELRLVTLLFCDIVDSVGLSSRLDAEAYGAVILAYRQACASEVGSRGGRILQYAGDGVLACFGFPLAHEDDAVCALEAGLGVLRAVRVLSERLSRDGAPALAVRLAAHTDQVMAGDLGDGPAREAMAVIGAATNVAGRLHQAAAPGQLVASGATWRAASGFFIGEPLGAFPLRGLPLPVEAYAVLGRSGASSRLEARPVLAPFCGRRRELEMMGRLWRAARQGRGGAVLLHGEAGVGKSRLLREFRDGLSDDAPLVLTCQCLPEHRTSALQPLARPLAVLLGLPEGATPEMVRDGIAAAVPEGLDDAGRQALLDGLTGILAPQALPVAAGEAASPRLRRERGLAAVAECLLARAAPRGLLLLVEDLHWADDSTLSLLEGVLSRLEAAPQDAPVLVAMTTRPEFADPLLDHPGIARVELHPLPAAETEALVTAVAGGKRLPVAVQWEIVRRTEGIPLFVEELTSTVLESGQLRERAGHYELAGPLQPLSMPKTLQGSLMARLDRMAADKPVAQLCAALGRSFSLGLAQAVAQRPAAEIAAALRRLAEERFLDHLGHGPNGAVYSFRHALIQEAAYESLLHGHRRVIHRRIADALRGEFAAEVAGRPEILANHLGLAGLRAEAVAAWERAGRAAAERSASTEAVAHFRHALDLLGEPPRGPAAETALRLHIALGTQYLITRGNGAPEVQQAFDAALALSQDIAGTPAAYRALYGLQTFYIVRGQLAVAQPLGRRMLELANRLDEPGLVVQARRLAGLVALYQGDFAVAEAELEAAWALYRPQRDAAQRFEFGSDPGTLTLCALGWTRWFRGRAAEALALDAEALELGGRLRHPHSRAFALSFSASLRQSLGQPAETLRQAETVIALAHGQGFPYWAAWGETLAGWAQVARATDAAAPEAGKAGLRRLRQGLRDFAAIGGDMVRSYGLMLLADAQLRLGQAEDAAATAAAGLAEVERNGVRFLAAELHRLHGLALLALGAGVEAALDSLRAAVALAAEQGAPVLERRALESLLATLPPADPRRPALEARRRRLARPDGEGAETVGPGELAG